MSVSKKVGARADFDLKEGDIIAQKYEILQPLGSGYEGEVFLIKEVETGIERAAKFFFPSRNVNNRTIKSYAKKLHKLRHCNILIKYHTQEYLEIKGIKIPFLVSEYVEGEILSDFLKNQPGKKLHPHQALHLLYSLVKGVEAIHNEKEYHGDIHTGNVIVERYGLGFTLKLIDVFNFSPNSKSANIEDDVWDMIKVFYDCLGGKKHYAKQDDLIKSICCGLKSSTINKKFKNATKLRQYIENLEWD